MDLAYKPRLFNLEEALLGLPIVTRSGKKIQIIKYDNLRNKLWVKHSPEEEYEQYFLDGKYHYNLTCEADLFMEPLTKTEIYFAVKDDDYGNINFVPARKIKEFKDPVIIQTIEIDVPISKEEWLELNEGTSNLTKVELVDNNILTFKDLMNIVDRMKMYKVPVDTQLYFMDKNQNEFALKNKVILTTVGNPENSKLCFKLNIEKKG